MVKFYVNKIQSGAINPKTGAPWVVADVPTKWRAEVEAALNE